jgi:hypothetical protein
MRCKNNIFVEEFTNKIYNGKICNTIKCRGVPLVVDEEKKLERAIEIMKCLTEGVNPFTGEIYEDNALINDPRMVRCLYYVVEVLEKHKAGSGVRYVQRKDLPYRFPQELMARVVMPPEKLGVNAFARCVNAVIDASTCKNLTGSALNAQLKKMGMLQDIEEGGKHRTAMNDRSSEYGIETVMADFNGRTYEKIVFNDTGKRYLLEHLQEIMDFAG